MNTQVLTNWIQLATGVAVLIGLGLVIWELQQAREIAVAQQINNSMSQYSNQLQAMMGEESARSLAKACDEPDSLTTEDMIVLGYYYNEIVNRLRGQWELEANTDLAVFDWRAWSGNFDIIFATEYGRWWWSRGDWEGEIRDAGNRWLAEKEVISCSDRFDSYRNRKGIVENR